MTNHLLNRRYAFIADVLQKEAYRQQMIGRTKPLKQFDPCAKGLVFTAAISSGMVSAQAIQKAAYTLCSCHPDLTEDNLWGIYGDAIDAVKLGA